MQQINTSFFMCFEFDFVMVGWDTTVGAASRLWAE
jgi:hypothetical protein